MKVFTRQDILDLRPCEGTVIPDGWTGTVIDILDHLDYAHQDRLWCALRFVDKSIIKAFIEYYTKDLNPAYATVYAAAGAATDADYAYAADAARRSQVAKLRELITNQE
jgi:hypothetical protein